MCNKCKDEVTSDNKCSRCGTTINKEDTFINPNFDRSRFDALKADDGKVVNKNFDMESFNRLSEGGE
jgi:hypothetical protein